jgi:hypothetical protein
MQKPPLTLADRLAACASWLHLDRLANRWRCRWYRIWRDRNKRPFMHGFSPMGAIPPHVCSTLVLVRGRSFPTRWKVSQVSCLQGSTQKGYSQLPFFCNYFLLTPLWSDRSLRILENPNYCEWG